MQTRRHVARRLTAPQNSPTGLRPCDKDVVGHAANTQTPVLPRCPPADADPHQRTPADVTKRPSPGNLIQLEEEKRNCPPACLTGVFNRNQAPQTGHAAVLSRGRFARHSDR